MSAQVRQQLSPTPTAHHLTTPAAAIQFPVRTVPDLPAILDTIRHQRDDERHWLALAGWLWDNGRDDEAAVVRVFWPVIRYEIECERSVEDALDLVRRNAELLGKQARESGEGKSDGNGQLTR
jgi:hypothetical protein